METNNNRMYRPLQPSDLPKVQSGKLKAFFKWYDHVVSAHLISTNYGIHSPRNDRTCWLIEANIRNLNDRSIQSIHEGMNTIFIDVTPERRFLIWSVKKDRFCILTSNDRSVSADWYKSEGEAAAVVAEFCHRNEYKTSMYKIIPFDYPGE